MLRDLCISLFRRLRRSSSPSVLEVGANQDGPAAADTLQTLLARCRDVVECNHLGEQYGREGKKATALGCFERCIALDAAYLPARLNLGNLYFGANRIDEALEQYAAVLALERDHHHALNNMGMALVQVGRPMEGIERLREALRLQPDFEQARSNLLLALTVAPGIEQQELLEEHRRLPRRIDQAMHNRVRGYRNTPEPERRLRVGYLSADFKQHPVAFFMAPILAHHKRDRVTIFCYSNWHRSDETTDALRKQVVNWRQVDKMEDDAAAALIRDDAIDILVDLSGRTNGARLGILARKPVPVQMTYLGYPNTTGLATVDYRITDNYGDPAGASEAYYTEKLLRMPNCMWCYAARAEMPEVSELPAKATGYITFGSFNNAFKLNPELIALWSRVLKAVPLSRIVIACLPEGQTRSRISAQFKEHGVAEERLIMRGRLPAARYWRLHHEVDIALDADPCNGGATTCDSLWMGVPVISLCGSRFVSRAGYSILANAGLQQLVANNRDQYVEIAATLAANTSSLAVLRQKLRGQFAASPICDAATFTLNLEALYRKAWQSWCSSQ